MKMVFIRESFTIQLRFDLKESEIRKVEFELKEHKTCNQLYQMCWKKRV